MSTFTSVALGADIQRAATLNEIDRALYERFTVTGAASKPTWATAAGGVTVGMDIQAAAYWNSRQTAFETLVVNALAAGKPFIAVGDVGTPATDLLALHNESTFPAFTTAAELWTYVSGNASGPRRQRNAGEWLYGKCQAGDIVGPWLIEDMQVAARFLRWTLTTATATGGTAKRWQSRGSDDYSYCDSAWFSSGEGLSWSDIARRYNLNLANTSSGNASVYKWTYWGPAGTLPGDLESTAVWAGRWDLWRTGSDRIVGNEWGRILTISPSLNTAFGKKYSVFAKPTEFWYYFSTPPEPIILEYTPWNNQDVDSGNYAYIGETTTWATTSMSCDVRQMLHDHLDPTAYAGVPAGTDRHLSCQYVDPVVVTLWNFSNP